MFLFKVFITSLRHFIHLRLDLIEIALVILIFPVSYYYDDNSLRNVPYQSFSYQIPSISRQYNSFQMSEEVPEGNPSNSQDDADRKWTYKARIAQHTEPREITYELEFYGPEPTVNQLRRAVMEKANIPEERCNFLLMVSFYSSRNVAFVSE